MNATAAQAIMPSTLVRASSSRCSGDRARVTEVSIVGDPAHLGLHAGAVTTIEPVPRVTEVFWKSMLCGPERGSPCGLGSRPWRPARSRR